MLKEYVFGRNCGIGLKLKSPMPIGLSTCDKRLAGGFDPRVDHIGG
jgi:hypothetical protein